MKIAFYSTKSYDRCFFEAYNNDYKHELNFLEPRLTLRNALLAEGCNAVCLFVNDHADAPVLKKLHEKGIRLILLRCAGFNNVDLKTAGELGMTVLRVPAYSPYAVAEHAVTLMMSLNRRIHKAYNRVREGNFALQGLLGFDMNGKTVGIIGTGKIGYLTAKILNGFGCKILGYDVYKNPDCEKIGMQYVDLPALLKSSDIISLHCPLTPETHYMINKETIAVMKTGVMLVNTGRGALINTQDVIESLKNGKIGNLALDVYEEESGLFFEDLSGEVIRDDVFARLLTFPNVLITGHQAFLTNEALTGIAQTTLQNAADFRSGTVNPANLVAAPKSGK